MSAGWSGPLATVTAPIALRGDVETERLGCTLLRCGTGRWLMAVGQRAIESMGSQWGGGAGPRSGRSRGGGGGRSSTSSPRKSSISHRNTVT